MRKLFYFFPAIAGWVIPSFALAHVKWFVDSEQILAQNTAPTNWYSISSPAVWIWLGLIVLAVIIGSQLDKIAKVPAWLTNLAQNHSKVINRVAQTFLGLFLISIALLWKIVIIPEADGDTNTILTVLQYIQIILGLMFVFDFKVKWASISLIVITIFSTIYSGGIEALLENLILLSLAFYFWINAEDNQSKIGSLKPYAVPILRWGTGLSLIILAITEKLLHPELSLAFLDIHQWNFMQPLFPWFTNELFVLSTGFAEIIFGVMFISGYLTRITTIAIAVFFALSVTTMLIQFGAWETEDLVVYAAAVIMLAYGSGQYMTLRSCLNKALKRPQIN
ncbi:MAG: hypothetical protein R3B41_02025 [Candidatus Doudnabacteria bacterium]